MNATATAPAPSLTAAQSLRACTKPFAQDQPFKSWWCILSTTFYLALAAAGTLPAFPLVLRIVASVLMGLLVVRLFVIYHDQ